MQLLNRRGYLPDATLHSYHCSCDSCEGSRHALKAQRDSSCDGELITKVLSFETKHYYAWGSPTDLMTAIQDAAVEADAEPSYEAGFHVHVDMNDVGGARRTEALWAFLRWEEVLMTLAAGRYETIRAANTTAYQQLRDAIACYITVGRLQRRAVMTAVEESIDFARVMANCLDWNRDRHSNLNTRTQYGTWEFRLWNSTRAAWRMEMNVRTSIAMVDPVVVTALNEAELPRPTDTGPFADILNEHGHSRAAELITRQIDYLRRDEPVPTLLTTF